MAAKDKYHVQVRHALEKEDWTITHDPYFLKLEGVNYPVDLGAEKMIAAQKEGVPHPQITVFLYKSEQSEIIASFLQEMRRENVTLFNNRKMFLDLLALRYDDIRSAAASTVATTATITMEAMMIAGASPQT